MLEQKQEEKSSHPLLPKVPLCLWCPTEQWWKVPSWAEFQAVLLKASCFQSCQLVPFCEDQKVEPDPLKTNEAICIDYNRRGGTPSKYHWEPLSTIGWVFHEKKLCLSRFDGMGHWRGRLLNACSRVSLGCKTLPSRWVTTSSKGESTLILHVASQKKKLSVLISRRVCMYVRVRKKFNKKDKRIQDQESWMAREVERRKFRLDNQEVEWP